MVSALGLCIFMGEHDVALGLRKLEPWHVSLCRQYSEIHVGKHLCLVRKIRVYAGFSGKPLKDQVFMVLRRPIRLIIFYKV